MNEKSKAYNLFIKQRIYRNDTLISYYFKSNKPIIKKFAPVDINGERMRMNLKTGEVDYYKKQQVLDCKNASLRRTNILVDMILIMNDFDWFLTLTFDKDKIDRTNDFLVFECYKKYMDNIQKKFPKIKYICFPERHHDEDNCIHFHLLVAGITAKQMGLVNSGKVCCSWATKKNGIASKEYFDKTQAKYVHTITDGEPIYNATSFIYGFSTVSRICDRERCNFYVQKYIKKDLGSTDAFKKRFYYSANLDVPEIVTQQIGADFLSPTDIDKVPFVEKDLYIQYAKSVWKNKDYNILQAKIDNKLKANLDKGLIPISPQEILNKRDNDLVKLLLQSKIDI